MSDEAFVKWLRDQRQKADDAAHRREDPDHVRDGAWGRCVAYEAVLAKLGRLEE